MLLDTNVWRYLVDADQVEDLRTLAKAKGVRVLVSPAVVYEMLRTGDPALRKRLVKAVTLGAWGRLMTEAYEESLEVLGAIKHHRAEWLRQSPDRTAFFRLQADWTSGSGFWNRARNDADREAALIAELEGELPSLARDQARQRRSEMKDLHFNKVDLAGWTGRLSGPMPGWEGTEVELWRFPTALVWWDATRAHSDNPYQDWLGPWLDLDRVRRERGSWNHLWLHEVQINEVERQWLRWAVEFLQGIRKVTDGTPVDNQISTYLIDTDVFLTGDGAFVDIVTKVRDALVVKVAKAMKLPVTTDPITSIGAALESDNSV